MGKINKGNQKAAKGRGNQGDWASPASIGTGELPEHAEHNREIERKKAAKKGSKTS
jgi:hypothetical protein